MGVGNEHFMSFQELFEIIHNDTFHPNSDSSYVISRVEGGKHEYFSWVQRPLRT